MKQVAIKYGLICGLVYIIFQLISTLTGLQGSSALILSLSFQLVVMLATFYVIYLGIKEYRDEANTGVLSLGNGIKLGLMIGLIAGVLVALFGYLYQTVIDPELMERTMEEMRASFEERGFTDEAIDQAMWMTELTKNPLLAASLGILWVAFWGFLKGLVGGAILQKHPTPE
jgi:ethanolamine transporter EutH